jgi:2'-5' RNA ligase
MNSIEPIDEADGLTSSLLRLFLAVPLAPDVRDALVRAQGRLRRTRARVGWVAPQNLHITLAFLGDVPAEAVPALGAALEAAGSPLASFDCRVAGLGHYGSPRSPRVLWAGVSEGAAELGRLYAAVAPAVAAQGIALEKRPFHAHITLGRVRSARDAADVLAALEPEREREFGPLRVESFELVRSVLQPAGPRYTVLRSVQLSGAPEE